jgi:hypothetical protein
MIILVVLIIFLFLEVLVKNVDKLKSILFNEDKNRTFLDNMHKYSVDEIKGQTRIRDFTSSNVNHYLNKIKKDPSSGYGFVLENILSYSDLSIENFNILFSEEFLKLNFLRDEIVIRVLMRYKDTLSQKNVLNLYNHFKNNEKIHKFIFATQIQSEFLVNENSQFIRYFKSFQSEKSSEFSKLKRELPNLWNDQQKLLSQLVTYGIFGWLCLTFFIITGFKSQPNFLLSNGYVNPSFSFIFLMIFIGESVYVIAMMYISWKIFSEKIWDKWDKFMYFVNTHND